jgi:type I restriction enzyme S subunit
MKSDYNRLGDYIQLVDVRNRDLAVTRLLGININKQFMPSVANVSETDLTRYKIIHEGQFAYSAMQVGRDETVRVCDYF